MNINELNEYINKFNEYRKIYATNLIASENINIGHDENTHSFSYRYAEGKPYNRYYNGTSYIDKIENECSIYISKKFNNCFVNIQPISGTIANIAVFNALKTNKRMISQSLNIGGHISHNKMGGASKILEFDIKNYIYKKNSYSIDIKNTIKLIKTYKPDFLLFGCSMVINYDDEIKSMSKLKKIFPNIPIVYDAAHVFGLIYQKQIKNPFNYGADIITASTHKTFPGPQKGIILYKDKKYQKNIDNNIFPALTSNHHLQHIVELYKTCLLLDNKYQMYSKKILDVSKLFRKKLIQNNFDVISENGSHQIIINVGDGERVANELEIYNIIVNKNSILNDTSVKHPSGIRIGVQEIILKQLQNYHAFITGDVDKEINKIIDDFIMILKNVIK